MRSTTLEKRLCEGKRVKKVGKVSFGSLRSQLVNIHEIQLK